MLYSTPAAVLSDLMARCDSPAISFHSDLIPKRQLVENFYFGCPCVESSLRILHNFYLRYLSFLGYIRVIDIPFSSQMPPPSNVKCHPLSVGGNRETPSTLDRKEKVDTKQIFPVFFVGNYFRKKVIKRNK